MTNTLRPLGGALAVALLATGCGGEAAEPADGALHHEVDSAGGVETVRSRGLPPAWDAAPAVSVGSEAQIGDPAPDEFGMVTSVTPDRAGHLWVADGQNAEIRVFGTGGELVKRLGREGQGPGEFLSIYSLAWVGERLLVLDLGNGRVGELDSAGAWLGTRPAPGRLTGSPALLRFYPVTDDRSHQWSLKSTGDGVERVWVEHGEEGITAEWVQQSPEPPESTGVMCSTADGGISFYEVPFGGQILQHPAGSGNTYAAWSADYRVALISPRGDTLRVMERAWDPLPISDAEWDSASAGYDDFREEWPGADCDPPGLRRPRAKAALRSLLMDTDGNLWAEVFTESGTAWEIFDSSGRLQGRIPGFDYDERVAPSIRYGYLAWVDRDSLGVQRAHMVSIERSGNRK